MKKVIYSVTKISSVVQHLNMKLVLVKVDHYPNFDIRKIYHGCGFKKNDGFNELID